MIVIPVQLTVGCVGRIFPDVGTAAGEVFWFVGISISSLEHAKGDRQMEVQYMPKTAAKNSIHACMLAASALDTSGRSHNIKLKQVAGARSRF